MSERGELSEIFVLAGNHVLVGSVMKVVVMDGVGCAGDLQAFVHVLKRLTRLFEEIVDYRFAELALLFVVVHF